MLLAAGGLAVASLRRQAQTVPAAG
jgi:hypothetical protein